MTTITHIGKQEEGEEESTIQLRDSDPSSPIENQVWLNTTSGVIKYFDGSEKNTLGVDIESIEYGENLTAGDAIQVYDDGGAKIKKIGIGEEANFFGVVQVTASLGSSRSISLIGDTSLSHSGATPGDIAYIQTDGTLGSTVTSYKAGRYISPTKLRLTKNP